MPIGNAPQYRGIEAVLTAYENAAIAAYAVCYDKDINLRYAGESVEEGTELLKAWLKCIKDGGSNAIYQMRLYEDLEGKSIRSNTAYDMAFRFVLNEREGSSNLPVRMEGNIISQPELMRLLNEMAELKADNAVLTLKVEQYENEPDEPEEVKQPVPTMQSIGAVLVEKLTPALATIGERLVDALLPVQQPVHVSGIVIETGNIDEEKLIEQSIRRLRNKIPSAPGVANVLCKLADMAEKSPVEFNFYMGVLMRKSY